MKKNLSKNIRIALVHDILNEYGGGEKVLSHLVSLFPTADVITSVSTNEVIKKTGLVTKDVKSSWWQSFSQLLPFSRLIQLLSPAIWLLLTFDDYDVVISHGGFYLANLVHLRAKPHQLHIHYAITPAKNLYYASQRRWYEVILQITYYPILRYLDKWSLQKCDRVIAISFEVAKRIKAQYKITAPVIFPPIDINTSKKNLQERQLFYCYVGRLAKEKNLDILIEAFNELKKPLTLIGEGKDHQRLKKIARNNITFFGFKQYPQAFLKKCRAFIHTSKLDDFPLSLVEALSWGSPIIAYKAGGVKEILVEGKNGVFMRTHSKEGVIEAVKHFERLKLNPLDCFESAQPYSTQKFKNDFLFLIRKEHEKKKYSYHS